MSDKLRTRYNNQESRWDLAAKVQLGALAVLQAIAMMKGLAVTVDKVQEVSYTHTIPGYDHELSQSVDEVMSQLPDNQSNGRVVCHNTRTQGMNGYVEVRWSPLLRRKIPSAAMYIDTTICEDVASINVDKAKSGELTDKQLYALYILYHEEAHVDGELRENEASCDAYLEMLDNFPKQQVALDGIVANTIERQPPEYGNGTCASLIGGLWPIDAP